MCLDERRMGRLGGRGTVRDEEETAGGMRGGSKRCLGCCMAWPGRGGIDGDGAARGVEDGCQDGGERRSLAERGEE